MTVRLWRALLAVMCVAIRPLPSASVAPNAANRQQREQFRARADLVVVDVTVLNRGAPVAGLTTSDFQVLDDGVPQVLESMAPDSVPLDVSLVVGTDSINTTAPLRFWDSIPIVASKLRAGDRLGLMTFSMAVYEEFPLESAPFRIPTQPRYSRGWAPLYDALVQAVLRPGTAARRHVIVLMTGGESGMSVSSPAQALEIVQRSDALVYVVLRRGGAAWIDPLLDDIAQTTGGDVLKESDLARAFDHILAGLDKGYVLTYSPHDVARAGWHAIEVKVTKPGNFTVRARRGYFGGS